MKKLLMSIVAAMSVVLLAGAGYGATASAEALFAGGENSTTTVEKSQTVDGSAYLAGNVVTVDGTVKGDVYCAASTVKISGTVEGDVLCAAATIDIDGTVNGDVRLAASSVTLDGTVDGSATVMAGSVTTSDGFSLGQDMTGAADTFKLGGTIGRDAVLGATTVEINGNVERNAELGVETIRFGDGGVVGGDLSYASDNKLSIPEQAVAGNTTFTEVENAGKNDATTAGAAVVGGLLTILGLVVLALLVTAVAPRMVRSVADVSWPVVGLAALIGLTYLVVTPIAAVILMLTGIGLLAGITLLFVWLLTLLLSSVPVAYFVGTQLLGQNVHNVIGRAVLGALVLGVLLLVPIVNFFVLLAIVLVGTGLFLVHMKHQYGDRAYTAAPAKTTKTTKTTKSTSSTKPKSTKKRG
jgi:cytoskeletal protein CcmA (bactofilin family)